MGHPELYDDAIADMNYHKNVMKLMKVCGVHDFGMKDLHSPKTKRLLVQLSGIINFAKYREDRILLYEELSEHRRELSKILEDGMEEQEKLKQHLETIRVQSSINSKKVQELNSEQYQIEVELSRKNQLQASLRKEINELTKQADDLKYQLVTIARTLHETEKEGSVLQSAIVRSPEKVQVQLEQLSQHVEDEKAEIYNAELEAENTKQKIENVDDAIYQTKKYYGLVSDVINEIERYKKVMEDVEIWKRDCAVLEERLRDLKDENLNADNVLKQHGELKYNQ